MIREAISSTRVKPSENHLLDHLLVLLKRLEEKILNFLAEIKKNQFL